VAVRFNTVRFNTVPFNMVPFSTVPFNTVPFNTVPAACNPKGNPPGINAPRPPNRSLGGATNKELHCWFDPAVRFLLREYKPTRKGK
jgi:hypothetical protein